MAVSIDIYASTNPALGALIIRAFVEAYVKEDPAGVPLSLIYLPLPIVLSGEIASTLEETVATTGLLPWVGRFPQVTIGFPERLTRTAKFSRHGLLFGIRQRILTVNDQGHVLPISTGLKRKPNFDAVTEPGRAMKLAKRLGGWTGRVRSEETVFVCLGAHR
ncbi:MAG: hypothetical protein K1X67_22925 [Fimbriimonadaceae bacterium]|nr:hypothetical protein [Fimbriimonadaceae bacterium]